ncbi:MAG: hypothetical protein K8J31_22590, partial [Anaerolineae bacterium]|nr:hypothetical protein [Anaerolineae bacterium]
YNGLIDKNILLRSYKPTGLSLKTEPPKRLSVTGSRRMSLHSKSLEKELRKWTSKETAHNRPSKSLRND